MLQRALRTSRPQAALTARPVLCAQKRTLITPTTIRSADLVQDMYLKELKAYKIPQAKASDAQGQVQTFKVPQSPKTPADTEDMARSLKDYDTQVVEVEMRSTSAGAGAGMPAKDEEWLEMDEDEEIDTPPKASH